MENLGQNVITQLTPNESGKAIQKKFEPLTVERSRGAPAIQLVFDLSLEKYYCPCPKHNSINDNLAQAPLVCMQEATLWSSAET